MLPQPSTLPSRRTASDDARRRNLVRAVLLALIMLSGCVASRGGADDTGTDRSATTTSEANTDDNAAVDPLWRPSAADVRALVVPYFDSERATGALQALEAGRYSEAATAFAALREDSTLDEPRQHALTFLLGLARLEQGLFSDAHTTLEPLAASNSALAPLAAVLAAEAAFELDRTDDAARLLDGAERTAALAARGNALEGRILLARSKPAEAVTRLAASVDKLQGPSARRARLALARALDATGKLEDAARHYRRIVRDHASTDEAALARAELATLEPRLPTDTKPPAEDPMVAARSLFERHRSEEAIAAFEAILAGIDAKTQNALWCEANYLIGKSYTKLRKHDDASRAYDKVVDGCTGNMRRDALYNGARAYWNVDRNQDAIARFEQLIKEFPEASLADDAYLLIARIQLDDGRTEDAEKTLRAQVRDYPDGDMAKDAHWLIFKRLYTEGALEEAVGYVDSVGATANEDDIYSRGRLAYFRARALELHARPDEARTAFARVIEQYPLSYYAMLAFGRLQAIAPDDARALASSLRSRSWDPERDVVELRPADLDQKAAFQRGIELARLGLPSWSRTELASLEAQYPNDPDLRYTLAALYEATGARAQSHALAAEKLNEQPVYFNDDTGRARWSLAYPRPWLGSVLAAAQRQGVPTELVYSIMREESGFRPTIESWANAHGLMQLLVPTAERMARRVGLPKPSASDLHEPEVNIPLGTAYLGTLGERYNGHPFFIVAGYNGGEGNVDRWLSNNGSMPIDLWVEEIPFGQTREYVKRVMMTYWRYTWLYEKGLPIVEVDPATQAGVAAGKS